MLNFAFYNMEHNLYVIVSTMGDTLEFEALWVRIAPYVLLSLILAWIKMPKTAKLRRCTYNEYIKWQSMSVRVLYR